MELATALVGSFDQPVEVVLGMPDLEIPVKCPGKETGSPRGAGRGQCGNRSQPVVGVDQQTRSRASPSPVSQSQVPNKYQILYFLTLVVRYARDKKFPFFFVRFVEKRLVNVGNVWYLICY